MTDDLQRIERELASLIDVWKRTRQRQGKATVGPLTEALEGTVCSLYRDYCERVLPAQVLDVVVDLLNIPREMVHVEGDTGNLAVTLEHHDMTPGGSFLALFHPVNMALGDPVAKVVRSELQVEHLYHFATCLAVLDICEAKGLLWPSNIASLVRVYPSEELKFGGAGVLKVRSLLGGSGGFYEKEIPIASSIRTDFPCLSGLLRAQLFDEVY